MTRAVFMIAVFILIGCRTNKKNPADAGKSRLERVGNRSDRDKIISPALQDSIRHDIQMVLGKIETLDSLQLFFISDKMELTRIGMRWPTKEKLIEDSYYFWKYDNVSSTFVTYPAANGEQKKRYVLEVENENLTGTCRMFFDDPGSKELNALEYSERE